MKNSKRMKFSRIVCRLFAFVVMCVAVAGCGGGSSGPGPEPPVPPPLNPPVVPVLAKAVALKSFSTCADLKGVIEKTLKDEMEARIQQMEEGCKRGRGWNRCPDDAACAMAYTGDGSSETPDVTGTNLQEDGVDEDDLIKNDGAHSYAIVGDKVRIVRVWPFENFGEVSSISPPGRPLGLFIHEKRLIVLSQNVTSNSLTPFTNDDEKIFVEVFDVNDAANPVRHGLTEYSGALVSSRMTGSSLHIVIAGKYEPVELDYGSEEDIYADCSGDSAELPQSFVEAVKNIRERNLEVIENINVAAALPGGGDVNDEFCSTVYSSDLSPGVDTLTIVTDDVADDAGAIGSSTIIGNGGTVYASQNGIYVAAPYNLSAEEAGQNGQMSDATVIHRFTLDGGPHYFGSNAVAGHLMDNSYVGSRYSSRFSMAQFAMSEHKGMLRVATTIGHVVRGDSSTESQVAVLDAGSPGMEAVGGVKDMGKGERIYAVRFAGERGYVVTFKKVDPLYVLDLSDPRGAKVAGELKTPGFSTYLHPIGEGRLVGLGFNADDQGDFAWTQGLKLSMFDVSDAANPAEVGTELIGARGSYSDAVEEHHAFTFDKERMLIALPVEFYEGDRSGSTFGRYSGSSVWLIRVSEAGSFDEVGRAEVAGGGGSRHYWTRDTVILRTAIIGDGQNDGVITLTGSSLQLNRIDAGMTKVGEVR